jgi:hypothetical protein
MASMWANLAAICGRSMPSFIAARICSSSAATTVSSVWSSQETLHRIGSQACPRPHGFYESGDSVNSGRTRHDAVR